MSVAPGNAAARLGSRPRARAILLAALLFAARTVATGSEDRPADGAGAFRHVLALSGTIGPRKSGTDADRRAIEYIAREMEAAGLVVERQAVPIAIEPAGERSIGSSNVIGELAGAVRDTIVVAAHHDSKSVVVPGANDDASGVAVLLEVARALAANKHRLTYRFISFCAEEEGLLGSRFYTEHGDLSPVRAMIALELVGRGELLIGPVPQPPALWAQSLLLRAARETGERGVVARPLWAIAPRFLDLPFSADHEPFLQRGVPAFLVLGTYPAWTYHTPEDGVNGVRPEALERAARVVARILEDLDATQPVFRDDHHYLPLMLFGRGVLLPSSVLTILSCAALLGFGILTIARVRAVARARAFGEAFRVLIVTGASTALGLSGLFLPEKLLERIHGTRFPWMAHQGLHVAGAVAFGLVTSWLGLNLFRKIKPTVEPGPYLAVAFLLPVASVAAALHARLPEIAAVMAVPVLMLTISVFFESTGRKLALGLGAAAPFFFLITLRDYKTLVDLGGIAPPGWALFGAAFAIVFPLALYLAHVASFQDCLHSRAWWWLSGRGVGLAVLTVALVLLTINAVLPPYDYRHRQVVRVRQRVDLNAHRASAMVRSQDRLKGVRFFGAGDPAVDPRATTDRFDVPFPQEGLSFDAAIARGEDPAETVVVTRLVAPAATHRLSYLFSSRAGFRVPGRGAELRHLYTFTELVPQRDPKGSYRLTLPASGDLSVDVRAEFEEDLLGLRPSSDLARVFVHQATVEGSRRLLGAPPGAETDTAAPAGTGR